MAKSYQEILGAQNMMGVMQQTLTGVEKFFPESFYRVIDRKVGNVATYFKATGERGNAKQTTYGAPARRVTAKSMAATGITLIHTFENQAINPLTLQSVLNPANEAFQQVAVGEIDRQTRDFKARFETLRTNCVNSAFALGHIYFDGAGNLLSSSSGAVIDIDFSVPSGQQNQGGGIIGASWATGSTDIKGDLIAVKKTARQAGRRPLVHAFYGENIPGYLTANDSIKSLLNANPSLAARAYESGEIPDGLCGLSWHPVYSAYNDDTSTAWFTGDNLILTPEPDPSWFGIVEGSMMVPRTVDVMPGDAASAMANLDLVFGMFNYAKVNHNPPGVEQYAGDTFLPLLKDGNQIWILDVTP